jgi:hypothetical protein
MAGLSNMSVVERFKIREHSTLSRYQKKKKKRVLKLEYTPFVSKKKKQTNKI